jgi:hypothetical protein
MWGLRAFLFSRLPNGLKRRVKLKGHRLGVDMSCSRGFIVALLHRFDFLEYVWQGGSLERNLNAGIVRRAVVGYSAPLNLCYGLLAGMVSVGRSVPALCLLCAGRCLNSKYKKILLTISMTAHGGEGLW